MSAAACGTAGLIPGDPASAGSASSTHDDRGGHPMMPTALLYALMDEDARATCNRAASRRTAGDARSRARRLRVGRSEEPRS